MSAPAREAADPAPLGALVAERVQAGERFFAADSERLARLCHRMAERFARGGRLIALGATAPARSDARHVAVEFVHPVIVGKRALPALALVGDGEDLARETRRLASEADIAIAFGCEADGGQASAALGIARELGALTVAFAPADAEWELVPPTPAPDVRQELVETLYHVLWELVHVFFEHRGLLAGRDAQPVHDAGASGFLYPFLDQRESELEPVIASVRSSALAKARETGELRRATLLGGAEVLHEAADTLASCFAGGGKLLAFGNGGSATDAMDVVADFGAPRSEDGGFATIDLTADPAILTAIANDIGADAIFSRQVIAYGRPGDALLALSTSGNSPNVLAALAEARRRGVRTIAMVGYDGGRVAAEGHADHVLITPSEHIPRIQEAQASAYHVLRELVARRWSGREK